MRAQLENSWHLVPCRHSINILCRDGGCLVSLGIPVGIEVRGKGLPSVQEALGLTPGTTQQNRKRFFRHVTKGCTLLLLSRLAWSSIQPSSHTKVTMLSPGLSLFLQDTIKGPDCLIRGSGYTINFNLDLKPSSYLSERIAHLFQFAH